MDGWPTNEKTGCLQLVPDLSLPLPLGRLLTRVASLPVVDNENRLPSILEDGGKMKESVESSVSFELL